VPRDAVTVRAVLEAIAGVPWIVAERRVLPQRVEDRIALFDAIQLGTGSRRYVS
jgi:hypothetical protein